MVYQGMEIAKLLAEISYLSAVSYNGKVLGISSDSRNILPGYLFVALKGWQYDGHDYIPEAISKGAVAVIYQQGLYTPSQMNCNYIMAEDSRLALAQAANVFYHKPSRQLITIGVTGSKGKTTTAQLITAVLAAQPAKVGTISTLGSCAHKHILSHSARLTTPDPITIQQNLQCMLQAGCEYAVLECSSHALSAKLKRVDTVEFDIGVITNITHEHLNFHGSFAQYCQDKARLFQLVGQSTRQKQVLAGRVGVNKLAVINLDDSVTQALCTTIDPTLRQITYGLHKKAMLRAIHIYSSAQGIMFNAQTPTGKVKVRLALVGDFYIHNCLAALAVGVASGIDLEAMADALASVNTIKGRMEKVNLGQPFSVWIDYAHNPDSFTRIMRFAKRSTKGRLIAVFGSSGNGDRAKRMLQGQVAAAYCEQIYLTDEDPRSEDPLTILQDIMKGITATSFDSQHVHLIPDRRTAIKSALSYAKEGDTILLLGKGHEQSILYADKILAWDEYAITREVLNELGYNE